MTGLLITFCCVFVAALSVPVAIAIASTHGHPAKFIGFFLIPVTPIVAIVVAVVADIGWWLVLIAAAPVLIMLLGSLFRDSDGQNMLEHMNLVKSRGKRRTTG